MFDFFIYYKNNCQWCENAKRLIEAHGDTWSGLNIEGHPENLEEFREDFPTARTVPQIIDISNGALIEVGGYTDLVEYYGTSTVRKAPRE